MAPWLLLIALSSAFAQDPNPGPPHGKPKLGAGRRPAPQAPVVTRRLTPMGDAGVKVGLKRMRSGQYNLAIDRFNLELSVDPNSTPARRGLALSLAGARRCDEALPHLVDLRHLEVWDVDMAVAEGNCALRTGDVSRAEVAFAEAALLEPTDPDAWFGLSTARAAMADWDGFPEAREGLDETAWKARRVGTLGAVSDAWAWRTVGGDDAWDALAALKDTIDVYQGEARAARVEWLTIEGELWMDLGDPITAEETFGRGATLALRAPRVGSLRAEARRRMGSPAEALEILDNGRARRGEHYVKDAVRARILADLGRVDEAEAELAALSGDLPEVAASRWYLARHRGDDVGMARWEAAWRRLVPPPEQSLDQLIPWVTP